MSPVGPCSYYVPTNYIFSTMENVVLTDPGCLGTLTFTNYTQDSATTYGMRKWDTNTQTQERSADERSFLSFSTW
jgi:hypothetical protein